MVCDPPERHVVLEREDKVSFIGVILQLGGSSQGTPVMQYSFCDSTDRAQHVQKGAQPQWYLKVVLSAHLSVTGTDCQLLYTVTMETSTSTLGCEMQLHRAKPSQDCEGIQADNSSDTV